jgi:hypothetical protein
MNKILFVLVLAVMTLAFTVGAADDKKSAEKTHHHTVVIPLDTKPFTVKEKDVVRITGSVISGGQIKEAHTGHVHLVAENTITTVKNGHVLIGKFVKEFDYKPTGKGKVKVTITTREPTPGVSPIEKVYEFEVK